MKHSVTILMGILVVSVAAMVGLHGLELRELQRKGARIETFAQREAVVGKLIVEMEKYRRKSAGFRNLSIAETDNLKKDLTRNVNQGIEQLAKLDPTPAEKQLADKVGGKVAEFMTLSAQLEPQLFSRDVYYKEVARDLHDSIITDLASLRTQAVDHIESAREDLTQAVPTSTRFLFLAAGLVLASAFLILLREYFAHSRPLKRLQNRAEAIRTSRKFVLNHRPHHHNHTSARSEKGDRPLKGSYGEIEGVMNALSETVESLRKERRQFVTAIASDLRGPLVALQSGAGVLREKSGEKFTENERRAAGEVVNRSLLRLSSALDDLNDVVDIERSEMKLEEKIIDVRSVLSEVSMALGGAGASHEIRLSMPTSPIWVMMDPSRFERVMVNLVSKMTGFMPQGGRIDISMSRPSRGSFRGLEIIIQDAERVAHGRGAATGPEQELLKHWVSENGFTMALVHKVMEAHGGSVTASGVAGSNVHFTLRLPQERLGAGFVTSGPATQALPASPEAGGSVPFGLEGSRIQSMFAEQAINFGA